MLLTGVTQTMPLAMEKNAYKDITNKSSPEVSLKCEHKPNKSKIMKAMNEIME